MDDLLQPGTEPAEVVGGSGGHPFRLGHRGRPRQLLDQGPGQPDPAIVAPRELANVHRRRRAGFGRQARTRDDRQQLADPRVGRPLVVQPRQQRHLVAAMRGTSRGHVRLLVPAQHRRTRGQHRLLPRPNDQLVIGRLGIHGFFAPAFENDEGGTRWLLYHFILHPFRELPVVQGRVSTGWQIALLAAINPLDTPAVRLNTRLTIILRGLLTIRVAAVDAGILPRRGELRGKCARRRCHGSGHARPPF